MQKLQWMDRPTTKRMQGVCAWVGSCYSVHHLFFKRVELRSAHAKQDRGKPTMSLLHLIAAPSPSGAQIHPVPPHVRVPTPNYGLIPNYGPGNAPTLGIQPASGRSGPYGGMTIQPFPHNPTTPSPQPQVPGGSFGYSHTY